jgi:hypothetical protein
MACDGFSGMVERTTSHARVPVFIINGTVTDRKKRRVILTCQDIQKKMTSTNAVKFANSKNHAYEPDEFSEN